MAENPSALREDSLQRSSITLKPGETSVGRGGWWGGELITQKSTTTEEHTTENSREKPEIATEAVVTAQGRWGGGMSEGGRVEWSSTNVAMTVAPFPQQQQRKGHILIQRWKGVPIYTPPPSTAFCPRPRLQRFVRLFLRRQRSLITFPCGPHAHKFVGVFSLCVF